MRAVVAHEDITGRKRAEEQLREAKDEAEAANRAKDQFLAILSHELRTPLNPILLAASSMLERTPEPEELRPTIEMIRQNVNLQARLIDDLLDVMRIVRGKMPLHWGVSDFHDLIGLAIQVCRSQISGQQVLLAVDLAAGHHHVNGDSARLQQVLWNLLKNAAKFTPVGGTVTVRTRNEADPAAGSDRLVVEVADTGIGIEPDILPTIFDPFQQGETTITRKFGGLGLGLAICKGIVEAHGGTIAAVSGGRGQGTTFRVELKTMPDPDGEPGVSRAAVVPSAPSSPSCLTILVVEDEPATLRLMARLLRGLGHQVTTADTVAGALEAERGQDFGLIISDIGLTDGSGLELMRRITARRGAVPAIALTGYGMEDDIQRSRAAGFTTHMTKPIDFTKLEAMIRQVVRWSGVSARGSDPGLIGVRPASRPASIMAWLVALLRGRLLASCRPASSGDEPGWASEPRPGLDRPGPVADRGGPGEWGGGMATERQLQETVARCVSIMVYYHNTTRAPQAKERMIAEVELVAAWVLELDLSPGDTDRHIFRPVEGELLARYGPEVARGLHAEFLDAFEGFCPPSLNPEGRGIRPSK